MLFLIFLSSKYGINVFSPTSYVGLPPPSINIVLSFGVIIRELSPCPTSMK